MNRLLTLFPARWRFTFSLILFGALALSIILSPMGVLAGDDGVELDPVWNAPLEDVPAWLEMLDAPTQLYSEYQFPALAGRLITFGKVDASGCPNGGLLESGSANECGVQRAQPETYKWQNQFNPAIIAAAKDSGVPPLVLKNIFAWESQFWPQTIYVNTYEFGLGHITLMGADSTLRWNAPFYTSICATNFSSETCLKNYADQPANIRSALMGVVVQRANADCADCAYYLDLPKAERSISIFAQTLLANATFVRQYIRGRTGRPAASAIAYEDLWKFALTSYNAGPGCFLKAFSTTFNYGLPLDWKNFSNQLQPACRGAIPYVDYISKTDSYFPGHDPSLLVSPTPTSTGTPTATEATATVTITPEASPSVTATITATFPLQTPAVTVTPAETLSVTPSITPTPPIVVTPTATFTSTITATPGLTITPTVEISATSTSELLEAPHLSDEFVLKVDPQNKSASMQVLQTLGIDVAQDARQVEELNTLVVQVAPEQLAKALEILNQTAGILYAEPNYLVTISALPNDPGFSRQGNLTTVQVPEAWEAMTPGQEALVAVVDTGVDTTHPDLVGRLWRNSGETGIDASGKDKRLNGIDDDKNGYIDDWQGWNMVSANNNISDDQGHGTGLAGVIGAGIDNSIGIAGIAPNARLLIIKALNGNGYGTYAQVAEGIIYATNMGARIINLGFGGTGSSALLQSAVDYALIHGALVIAAGGNSGAATVYYPAGLPGVVAVSAVDNSGNRATFSSSGNHISLAAPGLDIPTTGLDGAYPSLSGTSLSAAHVSGVAALLASQRQFDSADKIRSALLGSALDLGEAGWDASFGSGLLQALEALKYTPGIVQTPTITPMPTGSPTPEPTQTGGLTIMALEEFWASVQACAYAITAPANSIVPPYPDTFDNLWANCSGRYAQGGGAWTISDLARTATSSVTTYTSIYSTRLDIRFYFLSGTWVDDIYALQISTNGTTWTTLETFDSTNPPPTAVAAARSYNVTTYVNTPAQVNGFQVRIVGISTTAGADTVNIYLDQASLIVVQNTAPSVSVSSPTNGSNFVQGRPISFVGSATDPEEGNLSGSMQWSSSRDGIIGTGDSFTKTNLSVGAHTITVTVADNRGLTASTSFTISIVANTPPVVNITAPTNGAAFDKGASILFSGTAIDANDGNISSNLVWYSDIDGPIGAGTSFSVSHLTPATHSITAQVFDQDGAPGSATITLVVRSASGPHGLFNGSTDGCAACHRPHSAVSSEYLLTYPASAATSNDFCLSCHSAGANAVSTHSNIDSNGKKEANFELLCVQCHNPHGSPNLFAVRSDVRVGAVPGSFTNMTPVSAAVVFTALKGPDSFDEPDTPEDAAHNADDICVTCHVNAGNPGSPIASHAGGPSHLGLLDYVGQSCIYCHPHNADSSSATKDGFMPVRGSCVGCHSIPQGARRAIVGVNGDFGRTSHHVGTAVTDADCVLCHDQSRHMAGTVRLLNVDLSSTVYVLDGINDAVDYENFCLSCHDLDGDGGDTSPFSDNVNMAGTSLQINPAKWGSASHNASKASFSGSCIDCHNNGHGSNKANLLAPYNYTSTGTPVDDLMVQEEYFCYQCHKSGGVAAADVMTNYTRPTRWVQAAAGENSLLTLNDRHDISTTDQTTGATHSGVKIECVSCHNPHTDNVSLKVIADPDPGDGRVPGAGYFSQGNTADFWTDWCLDCHDGSYPTTITPPTNVLVNIYASMSVNTHGAASGNVGTLESGFGYTINSLVQCRQCHGTHVQAPTRVNNVSNLFAILLQVRNAGNTTDIPTDGGSFLYELTNNNVATSSTSGYAWCNTCHLNSMGSNKSNCFSCHYHGASGKW